MTSRRNTEKRDKTGYFGYRLKLYTIFQEINKSRPKDSANNYKL